MTRRLLFPLVVICLSLSTHAQAQSWLGLLPAGSAVDWTQAGIPGGIPTNRTQCGSTLTPSGGGDSAAINAALSSCASAHPLPGAGGYVLLGPGTFQMNTALVMQSNVTLRGSGPRNTILNDTVNAYTKIQFGNTGPGSTYATITGGATQGSTSITVTGATINVGQLLVISQLDPSWVDEGDCTWCATGEGNTNQIVEVLTSSGGTVTFRPPLYYDYSPNSPRAYPFNPGVKYAGLEYLQIYANNTTNLCGNNGNRCGVEWFMGALYSWMRGVENNFADEGHAQLWYSLGVEVRDNFFHDGWYHRSGQNDNQLQLGYANSGSIIENNIFYRMHSSIIYSWGGGGDVVAYNYLAGNYHMEPPSYENWLIYDTGGHGAEPWFTLFEGNKGDKFQADNLHGGSAYFTLFRNYYRGSRLFTPPADTRGALQHTVNPTTCSPSATPTVECWEDNYYDMRAYSIDAPHVYYNLVGNLSNSPRLATHNPYGIMIAPATGGDHYTCISIGYNSASGGAGSSTSPGSAATTYLHGDFNCSSGTFQWASGVTHTLPASFYLSSPPPYWGSHAWPPIGPDVASGATGFNGAGYVSTIPAEDCFNNSAKDANGYPLFDPIACYPSSSSGGGNGPAPPTGLAAVVQ